jgi:hypothetical protein
LLTHIAATESVSLSGADKKLTAFVELEAAIRAVSRYSQQQQLFLQIFSLTSSRGFLRNITI